MAQAPELNDEPKKGIDQKDLQRYGAAALFLICTLPVFPLTFYAVTGLKEGPLQESLRWLALPQAPTLYGIYFVTMASTLLGSVVLPTLKVETPGRIGLLPAGVGVLVYTGLAAGAGIIFLWAVADVETYDTLRTHMPSGGGAAQLKAYASWAVGACLTVFAALFGVPAPKPPSAAQGGG